VPDGILNIDGFCWGLIKYAEGQLATLGAEKRAARSAAEEDTFRRYHIRIREWVEANGGRVWSTIGDCTIAHGFVTIDEAVAAATTIQRRLTDFNALENRLGTPLLVRIGVARGSLPEVPASERGEASISALDEVGHLQKDCPPGRVRISRSVYDSLRFWRQDFRPALSTDSKALSEGSMVWVDRMLTPQDLEGMKRLPPRQARSYPPIALTASDLRRLGFEGELQDVRKILPSALAVIGETRVGGTGVQPVSHPAATSDAVGILEVFAALESSGGVAAAIDEWVDTVDLAAQRDLVIVGSPAVNLFAYAVNQVLPAGFEEPNGGPMRIRIDCGSDQIRFPATYRHGTDDKHYGIVVLDRSPINPQRKLLWIAGISGMATQAAARFARDLVARPSTVLDTLGAVRPSAVVVRPRWKAGYGPEQYQGMWRVSEYEIVWAGRQYPAAQQAAAADRPQAGR